MVRDYKRKTTRAKIDPEVLLLAVKDIKERKGSFRDVAADYGINYRTLGRYCHKLDAMQQQTALSKDAAENPPLPQTSVKVESLDAAAWTGVQSSPFRLTRCGYAKPRMVNKMFY